MHVNNTACTENNSFKILLLLSQTADTTFLTIQDAPDP